MRNQNALETFYDNKDGDGLKYVVVIEANIKFPLGKVGSFSG